MVDHHVDRPGVDAQQCVKLTGPNRSIGSIPLLARAGQQWSSAKAADRTRHAQRQKPLGATRLSSFATRMTDGRSQAKLATVKISLPHSYQPSALSYQPVPKLMADSRELTAPQEPCSCGLRFDGLVATARGKTPDPIPNSAVKTLSADGTASQDAGE